MLDYLACLHEQEDGQEQSGREVRALLARIDAALAGEKGDGPECFTCEGSAAHLDIGDGQSFPCCGKQRCCENSTLGWTTAPLAKAAAETAAGVANAK